MIAEGRAALENGDLEQAAAKFRQRASSSRSPMTADARNAGISRTCCKTANKRAD